MKSLTLFIPYKYMYLTVNTQLLPSLELLKIYF